MVKNLGVVLLSFAMVGFTVNASEKVNLKQNNEASKAVFEIGDKAEIKVTCNDNWVVGPGSLGAYKISGTSDSIISVQNIEQQYRKAFNGNYAAINMEFGGDAKVNTEMITELQDMLKSGYSQETVQNIVKVVRQSKGTPVELVDNGTKIKIYSVMDNYFVIEFKYL